MGPKIMVDTILFSQHESSMCKKKRLGFLKRGPLGPHSSSRTGRDALGEVYVHIYTHWRLAVNIIHIYTREQVYVHLVHNRNSIGLYVHLYTLTRLVVNIYIYTQEGMNMYSMYITATAQDNMYICT